MEINSKLTKDELHLLVKQYKDSKSEDDLLKIMEEFKYFIKQFTELIKFKKFNIGSRAQKLFLSLFTRDKDTQIKLKYGKDVNYKYISSVITSLNLLTVMYEPEDLEQTFTEEFIRVVQRYENKDNENKFISYMSVAYPYAVGRAVQKMIKDPLVNLYNDKIVTHFTTPEGEEFDIFDIIPGDMDEWNQELWIDGSDCDERFLKITPYDRYILKLKHVDKLQDKAIAGELGVKPSSIIRRRGQAKKILKDIIQREVCPLCNKGYIYRKAGACLNCLKKKKAAKLQKEL
jgi:ribosomal protein L37AE/L43A